MHYSKPWREQCVKIIGWKVQQEGPGFKSQPYSKKELTIIIIFFKGKNASQTSLAVCDKLSH